MVHFFTFVSVSYHMETVTVLDSISDTKQCKVQNAATRCQLEVGVFYLLLPVPVVILSSLEGVHTIGNSTYYHLYDPGSVLQRT